MHECMRTSVLVGAAALVAGCTSGKRDGEDRKKGTLLPADSDPQASDAKGWTERARTHLLLEQHENTSAKASYLAVDVSGAAPTLHATIDAGALAMENWPDHFRTMVSHDRSEHFVAPEAAEGGWVLVHTRVTGERDRAAKVIRPPDSVHLAGDIALVGIDNEVGFVDFAAREPVYESLVQRPEVAYKAYDLFVRRGDWVVAIDDVVTPIYADTFRLGAKPVHSQAWEMPSFINGRYVMGALHRSDEESGTLFAIGTYGIMDGSGHDLVALAIDQGKLKAGGKVTLNATPLSDPPVLEEHVSRGTGKPEKLAAGTEVTPWTGLDLLYTGKDLDRVLVAAGARGLLMIPPSFGPQTKAEVFHAGGECSDVVVDRSRVYLLVGGDSPAVAAYESADGKLTQSWRAPLPGPFHRFVN
jgi:hypothetical protein